MLTPILIVGAISALAVLLSSLAWIESAKAAPSMYPAASGTKEERAAVRYWTPVRMRNAEAAELPPQDAAGRLASGGEATPVSNPNAAPQRFHGRLFFTYVGREGSRQDGSCSGTVVRAPNRSTMLTAGHCLYDETWSEDVLFVPAYRDGRAPLGEYPARWIGTTGQWKRFVSGSLDLAFSYDVGAAALGRDPLTGRTVQAALGGGRGIVFGMRRPARPFSVYGYPAVGAFDGETPYRCASRLAGRDSRAFSPRPGRISCNMTQGASGGGWIVEGGGSGRLASVTSYSVRDDPAHLYGPYFGAAARKLFRAVRGR